MGSAIAWFTLRGRRTRLRPETGHWRLVLVRPLRANAQTGLTGGAVPSLGRQAGFGCQAATSGAVGRSLS